MYVISIELNWKRQHEHSLRNVNRTSHNIHFESCDAWVWFSTRFGVSSHYIMHGFCVRVSHRTQSIHNIALQNKKKTQWRKFIEVSFGSWQEFHSSNSICVPVFENLKRISKSYIHHGNGIEFWQVIHIDFMTWKKNPPAFAVVVIHLYLYTDDDVLN